MHRLPTRGAGHERATDRDRSEARGRGGRRDPRDRDRHARLRVHGQGPLERVPEARVHGLAAAAHAPARRDRRPGRAGGRRAARRYGYERWTTDWRDIVADPAIGLFDNGGPNALHAEPTIAAAEAGKHVLCEKPLGRDADESYDIWQRVAATGVKHLCAFNYRFVPAVRLAREMIEAGELGEIRHFRGRYLQDWGDDPTLDTWRFHAAAAGSGALGDLGAHVIDLARFLVGEIASVSALVRTFMPGREVDDAVEAAAEFESGAVGTIEATRFALGRRNAFQWEINGSKGSLAFDMERLNELQVFRADGDRAAGSGPCSSPRPTIRSGASGGRPGTSSAGARPSSTRSTTCCARSRTTPTSPRTAPRSRTATARPRLRRDRPLERERAAGGDVPLTRSASGVYRESKGPLVSGRMPSAPAAAARSCRA